MTSVADCTCPVCMDLLDEPVVMPCKHELCHACFKLHVTITSLHCPICRKRLASWMRRSISAGTLIDKKRAEEVKKLRAKLKKSENAASSSSSSPSTSSASNAEISVKISMPGEVHAEYVAEKLKLQAELDEQRRLEEAASEALIKQLIDEDQKEVQQRKLQEAAASKAYIKRVLRSEGETFPGKASVVSDTCRRLRGSTLAHDNFASRRASTASYCSGRDREVSAAAGCATTTDHEAPTPDCAARTCSEPSSSASSSVASSSVTVSELNIFKHNISLSITAHENAKRMTGLLPNASNSGAATNPSLQQQQQLECDAEHRGDAPASHVAAVSSARPLLSARATSATTGNGQLSRPRSPDAGTSEQASRRTGSPSDGRSPSRQSRSRSPEVDRQPVTAPLLGFRGRSGFRGRGRSGFRGRRFGRQRSSVVNSPTSQAVRRRGSRGSTSHPSRSRSPLAGISSVAACRVGGRGRGRSSRRGDSLDSKGLLGSFRRPQSPDASTPCEPASRAGRPKSRRGSRFRSGMSRSPDVTISSMTASRLCRSNKRGGHGCSPMSLSPDGGRVSLHVSRMRGRRGKRGTCGSASMPQSPDARRPSVPGSRIDCRHSKTSSSASRGRWSRSRSRGGCRYSTPGPVHGGHRGASPSSPWSSTPSLFRFSAAVRPDVLLSAGTELNVPLLNGVALGEAAESDAVRPAAVPPLSPGCHQLVESDAEIALRLQNLYNLEHKYKLNGLRVPESEGEYGLRSRYDRKDRCTSFSVVARSADPSCGGCRQSDDRPMSPPAKAARRASGRVPFL